MKLNCTNCGQHIEVERRPAVDFPCPTCNGNISVKSDRAAQIRNSANSCFGLAVFFYLLGIIFIGVSLTDGSGNGIPSASTVIGVGLFLHLLSQIIHIRALLQEQVDK